MSCKFKSHNAEALSLCLKALLRKGAKPWVRHPETGMTPLHWLCSYGLSEMMADILKAASAFDAANKTCHLWNMITAKNQDGERSIDIAGRLYVPFNSIQLLSSLFPAAAVECLFGLSSFFFYLLVCFCLCAQSIPLHWLAFAFA